MNELEADNLKLKKRIIKFEDFAKKVGELDAQNTTLENCVKKLSDELADQGDKNYELVHRIKARDLDIQKLRESLNAEKSAVQKINKEFLDMKCSKEM